MVLWQLLRKFTNKNFLIRAMQQTSTRAKTLTSFGHVDKKKTARTYLLFLQLGKLIFGMTEDTYFVAYTCNLCICSCLHARVSHVGQLRVHVSCVGGQMLVPSVHNCSICRSHMEQLQESSAFEVASMYPMWDTLCTFLSFPTVQSYMYPVWEDRYWFIVYIFVVVNIYPIWDSYG